MLPLLFGVVACSSASDEAATPAENVDDVGEDLIEGEVASEDLVPADQAEAATDVRGAIGGDFIELVESDEQTLRVRIDAVEEQPLEVASDGGVTVVFDERVIVVALRVENRTSTDSDGLQFSTNCSNRDTALPMSSAFDTNVDAFNEPVPGGSFIEGTMLLQYPQDCEDGRITAGFFVGSMDRQTGTWPLS